MKFLLMIYTDQALLDALPEGEYDRLMKDCIEKADALRERGVLLDSQQLEVPSTARSIRARNGSTHVFDGPSIVYQPKTSPVVSSEPTRERTPNDTSL